MGLVGGGDGFCVDEGGRYVEKVGLVGGGEELVGGLGLLVVEGGRYVTIGLVVGGKYVVGDLVGNVKVTFGFG